MKRFVRCAKGALVVGVLIGVSLVYAPKISASTVGVWLNTPVVKLSETPQGSLGYSKTICSTEVYLVPIEGWNGLREACVFGSAGKPQVARYVGSSGVYLHAIKFPLDDSFIPIKDFCVNASRCVYGQTSDTFLLQVQQQFGFSTALFKDFTKHLVKYTDNGTYFRFEYPDEWKYISIGSRTAETNTVAVSANGKWALVELDSYGFVRVNLQTLEYKRVVAPGAQYGYGSDPSYEMTISDDGTKIAIAGWRASIAVYEVNSQCGDVLDDASTIYFSPYVYACEAAAIETYGMFPGFSTAHTPRFSHDGTKLSVVLEIGPDYRKATIAPVAYSNVTNGKSYIALGDSFTSGEGELSDAFYLPATNTKQNRCHVSSRSYPYLVGSAFGGVATNLACSGSRVPQVRDVSRAIKADSVVDAPSHISVGVGGNDIDLIGKLKTCLGPGTCEWARLEKRRATYQEIKAMFSEIVDLLSDIKSNYPEAAVALVGYPSVVNTSEDASCGIAVSSLLSSDERTYLDESLRYLNKVLRAAATYARVPYVDVETAFTGERLCDLKESSMNAVRLGDDIAPLSFLANLKIIGAESFHPTPRGHQLVANAFQSAVGGGWWSATDCVQCLFTEGQLAASEYWDEGVDSSAPVIRQKSERFLSATTIMNGLSTTFQFLPGSFLPGSTVNLELHSTPLKLASYIAADDGSLSGSITVPANMKGYHTVHAYGQAYSGTDIDIYETIAVEETVQDLPLVAVESPKISDNVVVSPTAIVLEKTTNGNSGHNRVIAAGIADEATNTVAISPLATTAQLKIAQPPAAPVLNEPAFAAEALLTFLKFAIGGGGAVIACFAVASWLKTRRDGKV